ncbi:MAG TPA: hypothetical protein VGM64_03200 [Lacunisphaera sp.]
MQSPAKSKARGLVIIGFAESFSSPEVAWSLVEAGFAVVAFARKNSKPALASSQYATIFEVTAPEEDVAAALRDVENGITRILETTHSPVSLLVLDDAALWIRARLKVDSRLTVVGPSNVEIALDKSHQIEAARSAGFKVPATFTPAIGEAWREPPFGFPLILKPVKAITEKEGRLDKGRFYICRTRVDYEAALKKIPTDGSMMAQQYVSGVGEGLFGLATPKGILAWSAHQRIRMMNPSGSGASACISIAPDGKDVSAGEKFIECVSWRGPFMIELLRAENGEIWFMEFNGRIWGSTALARRCRLEYPAWAVCDALNQNEAIPNNAQAPVGVVCRHAGREIVHGLFVMRGPRSQTPGKWPSRWTTVKHLLNFRRSDFWYNWRRDDWRVFFKDVRSTIAGNVFKKKQPKRP